MAGGPRRINEFNNSQTPEQRKANASRARKAGIKKQREMRMLKDVLLEIMASESPIPNELGEKMSYMEAFCKSVIVKGTKTGNFKALETVAELMGQKVSKTEIAVAPDPFDGMSTADLEKLVLNKK